MKHNTIIKVVISIMEQIDNNEIKIRPDYQRNYVWIDNEIQSKLIESILLNAPIGTIILHEKQNMNGDLETEVVDGQQRLKTIQDYLENKFSLNKVISSNIFKINKKEIEKAANQENENISKKAFKKLNNNNVNSTNFSELPKFLQKRIINYNLTTIIINNSTNEEVKKYFSVVQNQEKLKAGELINALPNNFVKNYFSVIFLSNMAEILNFNDTRMDILKQLNLLVGVSKNDLRFGVDDKSIFKYSESLKIEQEDEKITELFGLIINDFSQQTKQETRNKFSVFALKLYFLSNLFSDEFFQNKSIFIKRTIILEIIKYTSKFNSNDLNKKYNIPKEIKHHCEQVWKICKTTHNKSDLENIFFNHFYELTKYIIKRDNLL